MKAPVRVVLTDDHRIVREGVRSLLEGSSGDPPISVVGEAVDGSQAVALCQSLEPDVVVLDLALGSPLMGGFEVAAQLRTLGLATRPVALTMYASTEHVRKAREQGFRAYVVKGSGVGELAAAIRTVAAGNEGPFPNLDPDPLQALTPREREVLAQIAAGASNREIAQRLGISIHTVNTHRVHVMDKLGAHDVAALTRLAVGLGLA
jgi:DNA-binding NarL/FixJ family response regulator